MKRARHLPLFLLIAVFSAVAAQAGVERVFNESFSVQPGGDLVVYTSGGDIEISDLVGEVVARTSGGDIEVGHIDGPVNLHTSGGDIEVRYAVGDVKVHTSGGDIEVVDAEGLVNASTSVGDIKIGRVVGILHASTSGGNVSGAVAGTFTGRCRAEHQRRQRHGLGGRGNWVSTRRPN